MQSVQQHAGEGERHPASSHPALQLLWPGWPGRRLAGAGQPWVQTDGWVQTDSLPNLINNSQKTFWHWAEKLFTSHNETRDNWLAVQHCGKTWTSNRNKTDAIFCYKNWAHLSLQSVHQRFPERLDLQKTELLYSYLGTIFFHLHVWIALKLSQLFLWKFRLKNHLLYTNLPYSTSSFLSSFIITSVFSLPSSFAVTLSLLYLLHSPFCHGDNCWPRASLPSPPFYSISDRLLSDKA